MTLRCGFCNKVGVLATEGITRTALARYPRIFGTGDAHVRQYGICEDCIGQGFFYCAIPKRGAYETAGTD